MLSQKKSVLRNPTARFAIYALAILALALVSYSNSFKADFQFDDARQIVRNHYIRSLKNLPRFFAEAKTASYDPEYVSYRPVTIATHAVCYAVSGGKPWSFHAFNLGLHFFNAILLMLIIGRVLKEAGYERHETVSFLTAVVFSVHPLQSSAVTYITGRALLLGSFFWMLAFYSFLKHRDGAGAKAALWAAASLIFYFFGLLSKEMAVSMPAAALLFAVIFREKDWMAGAVRRWAIFPAYALVLAGFLLLKNLTQGSVLGQAVPYTVPVNLMSQAKALLIYLRLMVLPFNQNVDYALPPTGYPDALVFLSCLLIGFAVFMAWRVRKTNPAVTFFIGWFLLLHAPESSVVPIMDILVEYRVYLSSAGLYAIAIMALVSLRAGKRLKIAAASAAVLMLCLLTFSRNAVWADGATLWADSAAKAPDNARAMLNLGNALLDRQQYSEALVQFGKALPLEKDANEKVTIYFDMAAAYGELGNVEKAAGYFARVIEGDTSFMRMDALTGLGSLYFDKGRYSDAALVFEKVNKFSNGNPEVHFNLAVSYMMLGRYTEARDQMEAVLGLSLDNYEVRLNLSKIYQKLGDRANAVVNAERAASMAADGEQAAEAEGLLMELDGGR